jgi:hypothetical protein
VEPFAGSAAVLLGRPEFKGRRVETLNDADGWLVNTWRAIQLDPGAVAGHAAGPVTEIDYHARLAWLQQRRTPDLVAWLEGDPEAHDPKAAGWWLYVVSCSIGDPFEPGPWQVIDGHLRKTETGRGVARKLPHLGDAGKGVNRECGDLDGYVRHLAHRLRRVRITCGDWRRVLTPSASRARTGGDGSVAVFLDPPYATSGDVYAHGDTEVAAQVAAWCAANTRSGLRIALCGYEDEHDMLLGQGWTVAEGKSGGGAGYSTDPLAGRRERIWFSPACMSAHEQVALFG